MAYKSLSTANLPDPAIDPAQGSSPEDYFGTLLFTATAGVAGSVTGLGFAPDFSWTKARNTTQSHQLFDNVRGDGVRLITNSSSASTDLGATYLSLEDDGIDYGSSTFSSNTYVAWNWKAGTSFSNSAGTNGASIASSGSANTDSGFSIVSYTGDSTGTDGTASTVYHGLSQAPEMIMFKPLDTYDGAVYHSGLTSASYRLVLFSASGTLGEASDNGFFNGTAPTSSVFSIGSRKHTNSNGGMIAYCFHSVEGYSKFGSYTGNGSTDGPFVYTGFRPAFLLVKHINGTQDWHMLDSERGSYNVIGPYLYANSNGSENNATKVDFLSNGFKIRVGDNAMNSNGNTLIYMAFAENPFKYSNAR